MHATGVSGGPRQLLVLALVLAGWGGVFLLVATVIGKAIGMKIDEYERATRRYRDMPYFEGFVAFMSDVRSLPFMIGFCGVLSLFAAALAAGSAGVLLVVRALTR